MQLARITAVARSDVLIRVRRPASIAVFLILCALAYFVVPPVSSGNTLMQVDGHRALLTSGAIAIATAGVGAIFLGMLGFYLVSNTVRRDALTRTGYVIAAMPVSNAEYLTGKFFGNAAFLGLIALGCMFNVMVMQLLRGEGPLQPLVYLSIYLALMGPTICVVSALALFFECCKPLSGRVGDVLYFFVWTFMLVVVALGDKMVGLQWTNFTDVLGMRFLIQSVSVNGLGAGVNIGGMPYDPSKAPWVFPGVPWSPLIVATRVTSALVAVPILALAWIFFTRFDPAKMKAEVRHARSNVFALLNRILKPLTRILLIALSPRPGSRAGLGRIARSETALTFMLSPIALALIIALALWSALVPIPELLSKILPLCFIGILIATADIATRDADAGMTALLYSMPKVKRDYVVAKLIAAAATALAFVLVPLVRLAIVQPASALSLVVGALFVASLAVSLGTLTGSGKAFAGFFLLFLYLALNSGGAPPLDFAGWSGTATAGVRIGYLTISMILVAAAITRHRLRPA